MMAPYRLKPGELMLGELTISALRFIARLDSVSRSPRCVSWPQHCAGLISDSGQLISRPDKPPKSCRGTVRAVRGLQGPLRRAGGRPRTAYRVPVRKSAPERLNR